MITELKNPCTSNYLLLKQVLSGRDVPWNFETATCSEDRSETNVWGHGDMQWFSRNIIGRPVVNKKYSLPQSSENVVNLTAQVIEELLEYNDIRCGCIFRANVNLTFSHPEENSWSPKHTDHLFSHKNMLIYLDVPASGSQFRVWENEWSRDIKEEPEWGEFETFTPQNDSVIMFDGLKFHAGQSPTQPGETRIVLVVTFMEEV